MADIRDRLDPYSDFARHQRAHDAMMKSRRESKIAKEKLDKSEDELNDKKLRRLKDYENRLQIAKIQIEKEHDKNEIINNTLKKLSIIG